MEPKDLTVSTAARVVACSRTIRSRGKWAWSFLRWGRKVGSAFITWMFCTEFSVGDTRNSPDLPLMRRMALPREDLAPCLLLAWLQTRDNMLRKTLFHHLSLL